MAIGDYIHYYANNYHRYGIGKDAPGPGFQADNDALMDRLKTVSGGGESLNKNYTEVENFLNFALSKKGSFTTGNVVFKPEDILKWEADLSKIIQERFGIFEANFNNLSFENASNFDLQQPFILNDGKQYVQSRTVNKALDTLSEVIALLGKQITNSKDGAEIQKIEKLKADADKALAELNHVAMTNKGKSFSVDTHGNLFKKVNEIVASIAGPTQKDLGDLAEIYISYMLAAASNVAIKNYKDLEKYILQGFKTERTTLGGMANLTMQAFVKETDKQTKSKTSNWTQEIDNGDGTITSVHASQGTVDMSITFNDDIFNLGSLSASIKNYQNPFGGKYGIHILSGSPLMSVLMLTDTNFINHYLNMIVSQKGGPESSGFDTANEHVKLASAVRAVSGYRGQYSKKHNISQAFIINDRSAGRIRVISTGDLLNKLQEDIKNFVNVAGLPGANSISNPWMGENNILSEEEAAQRVAKVLAQVYAIKLSVSLDIPADV